VTLVAYDGTTPLNSSALVYRDTAAIWLSSNGALTTATPIALPHDLVQANGVPLQ
jgi:hypothetical protein